MKRTTSKNQIFAKTWRLACLVALTGLLGVACEREGNGSTKDDTGTISLQMTSGSTQGKRVSSIDFNRQKRLSKRKKLTYIATLNAPNDAKGYKWSATSVAFDPANDLAQGKNTVYVTWHSDRQATNYAIAWGGAIDVLNVLPGYAPEVKYTYTGVEGKSEVKFNHIHVGRNALFVSGTGWKLGGTIARIPLNNGEPVGTGSVECIGFPGSSVNAVAEHNGKLVAISGYKGTYAEFDAAVDARPYSYDHEEQNVIHPATDGIADNFGGKFVLNQDGKAYILYCGENTGMIQEVGGEAIELGKELTSIRKSAETYNEATGEWDLSAGTSPYYGKHTMAVKGNFAYVACGTSGLVGVNMETKARIADKNINVTGLYAAGSYLYAATGSGLRVYTIQEDGSLELYAFEVETYDEHTGEPTSENTATTGTAVRHSANYVAADTNTGYIYVAYGQSGVRIYKFTPEEPEIGIDMGGDILWYPENIDGYYAWGEIFCIDDPAGYELIYDQITYHNDGTYYTRTGRNKTIDDHKNFNGYRFFNGTRKLTKYTWKEELDADGNPVSEDGRTVLEPMDDVATVRLGDGWRIPTEEEWRELLALVQQTATVDGQTGVLFKAENGNELFLPQTGYYGWRNTLYWTDSCFYWSSSLSKVTGPNRFDGNKIMPEGECQGTLNGDSRVSNFWVPGCKATCMVAPLNGKAPYIHRHDRCCGMAIRPVKDKDY